MKNIFKRSPTNKSLFPVYQQLGTKMDDQQRKWADYLNGRTRKASKRWTVYNLIIFCLLFGGCCVYIFIQSVKNDSTRVSIEQIKIPAHAIPGGTDELFQNAPANPDEVLSHIIQFKMYMDSLKTSQAGKVKYDSIIKLQPGLLDSIEMLEEVSDSKNKNNDKRKGDH